MWASVAAFFGKTSPPPPALAPPVYAGPDPVEEFLGLCEDYAHLAPRDTSLAAFLDWLRASEDTDDRDWEQSELAEAYEEICCLAEVEAMPGRFFGRGLLAHGCTRWQANLKRNGKRWRPYIVHIPDQAPVLAPAGKPAAQVEPTPRNQIAHLAPWRDKQGRKGVGLACAA